MKQTLLPLLAACAMCACTASPEASDYAIVAGPGIADDPQWNSVVEALCESHPGARVIHYRDTVSEALPALREAAPRYVAFVEQPEQVGRAYIIALNRMSREVDEDIYADYLWGVITGYDAEAALRMVRDAREPLVIRSAVSTLREVGSGKWFDSFAYVDDRNAGICGEKKPGADSVSHYRTERLLEDGRPDLLRSFCDFYAAYDPDLITTASHATERNLEMPFSVGNLRARDGALYADFPEGPEALKESGKRRVFLPIGNCLIGNVNNTRESMAIAWMNSAHASAMAGLRRADVVRAQRMGRTEILAHDPRALLARRGLLPQPAGHAAPDRHVGSRAVPQAVPLRSRWFCRGGSGEGLRSGRT